MAPVIAKCVAGRHPGDGAHRLHPAERAHPRRLPGPGPRRRCRPGARGRPRGAGGRRLRGRHGDGPRRRRQPGHQGAHASPRSASAPATAATARCWSGRTPSGCAPGRMAKFVKQYADVHGVLLDAARAYADDVQGRHLPRSRAHLLIAPARRTVAACASSSHRSPSSSPASPARRPPIPAPSRSPWPPPPSRAPRRPRRPRKRRRNGEGRPAARGDAGSSPASTSRGTSSARPGAPLLFTQRDRARLSLVTERQAPARWLPEQQGLGLGRDRADVDRRRPGLRRQPPDLHLPGRLHGVGGTRRPGRSPGGWTASRPRHEPDRRCWSTGCPTTSGRHGGCRLLIDRETGVALVGTGDAADRHQPARPDSLGGKTLRLNRMTGAPWPTTRSPAPPTRGAYVHTYGHRNVQGLAERATARCGRSSTAPTATTRSTCSSTAATTAGTRSPATTSRCR